MVIVAVMAVAAGVLALVTAVAAAVASDVPMLAPDP